MKKSTFEKFKQVVELIEKYDQIVVLRHINPDGDACGSQLGLVTWIRDNYKDKKVYCLGKYNYKNDYFPVMDDVKVKGKYLLIITDTANIERIDGKEYMAGADKIVKIDHHPETEVYGDISIVDHKAMATSYMIGGCLIKIKDKIISPLCAKYLLAGVITDSGTFTHSGTVCDTFEVAGRLLKKTNMDISTEIISPLFIKTKDSFEVLKGFLNKVEFIDGIACVRFEQDDLDKLNVKASVVKDYLSNLSNIEGVYVWLSIAYDKDYNKYRVSMRSKRVDVSKVARKHNGGGHKLASGAEAKDDKEIKQIFKELYRSINKLRG